MLFVKIHVTGEIFKLYTRFIYKLAPIHKDYFF